jgi:hypothetical protein
MKVHPSPPPAASPAPAPSLLPRELEIRLWMATRSPFPFRGRSMFPVLREGDLLSCRPLDRDPLPGDIVVLCRDHRLVAHRVRVVLTGARVITQGDARLRADPPVPLNQILGLVQGLVDSRDGSLRSWPRSRIRWDRLFRWGSGGRRGRLLLPLRLGLRLAASLLALLRGQALGASRSGRHGRRRNRAVPS